MTKIFVYTGTGNSYASAKQMASEIENAEVIFITDELGESRTHIECETCIIIFPVYGYGMPKTVRRFIKQSTFKVDYFAVLGTVGSTQGGALAEAIRLLRGKGQKVHYTNRIKCVENYVHMFKLPTEEKIETLCQSQCELTSNIVQDIKARVENKRILLRPESSFVSGVFKVASPFFARRYRVDADCNGCGICYRVCPALAIEMKELRTIEINQETNEEIETIKKRPEFTAKKCDHCQACLQLCPKRAILFGKITKDGRRYCHKDANIKELFKR
ncbi:MAG: EFR1 family ferrodoxin [Firmicutes bacterium]|nr:EFR1 family ferrodoxin [Bacillota bacterium]